MAIASVIKYEGDNNTFIWKHPDEDFNSLTQLIVHESQEAIFFMNGEALDTFGPGRHTLETENIPKLGRFLNRTTDGDNPFHCEVYFINKTVQMSVKWGTDSKVRYIDPESGIPIELGACGEMNLAVSDGRKLLLKLVGTTNGIAWNDSGMGFTKSLQNSFRPLISTAVKSNLSSAIKAENFDILEIDEHLESLSKTLRGRIIDGFEEYGLTIPQFYLTTVVLPEDDPNFRELRKLHTVSLRQRTIMAEGEIKTTMAETEAAVTAAQRNVELERQTTQTEVAKREAEREVIAAKARAEAMKAEGFAEAEIMHAKGYNQKDVIQADVQKAYAEGIGNMTINGSGGGVAGDMIGLGVGMAAAGTIAPQLGDMFKGMNPANATSDETTSSQIRCPRCNESIPENAKFCLNCGEKIEIVPDGMIICPECKKTVQKGKFCLECGHKFITVCPKCGNELPENAKFCLECGEKL